MKVSNIIFIIALVILVTLFGVTGYQIIEGWNFLDSLYMTVITLTSTGYQEVHPLSENGRLFTIVLLFIGVGIVAYSISTLMSYFMSIDLYKRGRDKMNKKIQSLENHTIVCGFGRMGKVICDELRKHGDQFVVLENDPEEIEQLKKSDYLFIDGDAASDDHLLQAGIRNARVLVSMIDNDSDGLYIALAGRSLNKNLYIIVRANDDRARKRILRAGADKVVLPIMMSGMKVAECVINPAVEDFLDLTGDGSESRQFQLADLVVTSKSQLVNVSLNDIGPEMRDIIIVGVRKPDGEFIFYPKSDYIFEVNDCLIAMGKREDYESTLSKFNLSSVTPHSRNHKRT